MPPTTRQTKPTAKQTAKQTKVRGNPEPLPNQLCDSCRHASFDMQHKNLSIYGKPTLIICALRPFPKIVVGSPACENYRKSNTLQHELPR